MKISDNLFQCFNRQYNTEAGNFSMYQNLANLAGNLAWRGFETFFKEYALDEITHAQKIADFLIERNRTPFVDTLPNPQVGNKETPIDWVNMAYAKAQNYTAVIQGVYEQCEKEHDREAEVFLHWYLTEQRRVEQVFFDLSQELSRCGSNAAVLLIDQRYRK
jgi:ferritin